MASSDVNKKLEESRIITIVGGVDASYATEIIFKILSMSKENETEDINLYFGSGGGNYLDMLAIYDTMQSVPNHFSGTCVGKNANYAVLLLAACTKGKRYALPHSTVYFTQPTTHLGRGANQQTEVLIEAKELNHERAIFEQLMAKHTGQPLEKIHADLEDEMDLTAEQAKEYGIIDVILN